MESAVRIRMHLCGSLVAVTVACLLPVDQASAAKKGEIEAVQGMQYKLSREHGPWMILVATFREPPPEARTKGMTPKQAADELVYELRKKGLPAYTFMQEDVKDQIKTVDRFGREEERA